MIILFCPFCWLGSHSEASSFGFEGRDQSNVFCSTQPLLRPDKDQPDLPFSESSSPEIGQVEMK